MSDTTSSGNLGHDAHGHADDGEVHAHVGSLKMYIGVFLALIFFTLVTVGIAGVHLGPANLAVAIFVASIKAALVCTFFMHLNHDNRFNTLILISSILFIGVFFAYTTNDTGHRAKLDPQAGSKVDLATNKWAPGSYEPPVAPEHAKAEHKGEGAKAEHKSDGDKAVGHGGGGDHGGGDKGGAPAPVANLSPAASEAKAIFSTRCAACHGASGHGDGAAAAALNPKPRNFGDKDWQKAKTDEQIATAIVKGGAAVNLSAVMAPNQDLEQKPEVVKELVAIIRDTGK